MGILAQLTYFPKKIGRQTPRVEPWNQGYRPPDVEENPRSLYISSKVGRTGETAGTFQMHLRKTRMTRARAPLTSPPNNKAALEGTISRGGQEKRKDRKTRKSRSEGKVENFSSGCLFPARKREAVT